MSCLNERPKIGDIVISHYNGYIGRITSGPHHLSGNTTIHWSVGIIYSVDLANYDLSIYSMPKFIEDLMELYDT